MSEVNTFILAYFPVFVASRRHPVFSRVPLEKCAETDSMSQGFDLSSVFSPPPATIGLLIFPFLSVFLLIL